MVFSSRRIIASLLLLACAAGAASSAAAFCPQKARRTTTSTRTGVSCATPLFAASSGVRQQEKEAENNGAVILPVAEEVVVGAAAADDNDGVVDEDAEHVAFLAQCKRLCEERNLPLEKVKNARDLASVANANFESGHLFRMGRLGDATANDVQLLMKELQLKTLVDLRSPTELKDDPALLRNEVFADFTDMVWKEQGRGKDGCLKEIPAGQAPVQKRTKKSSFWRKVFKMGSSKSNTEVVVSDENAASLASTVIDNDTDEDCGDDDADYGDDVPCAVDCQDPDALSVAGYKYNGERKERLFVSLMNEFKYVKGTVSKLRKRDITKAVLKAPGAVFSRRVRSSVKKPFLDEINDGGLPMLNELLLRFGAPGIKYVLEICADPARHPVAFYCTAGKDRTGMVAAIVLGLCGVKAEDIVEDYTLSANVYAEMNDHQAMVGALSQRNLDPKTFLGAPAAVMRDTLEAIDEQYGSVEGYCEWIGFPAERQEQLRRAMGVGNNVKKDDDNAAGPTNGEQQQN